MTKEILLSIAGLHLTDGENGNIEVVTAGDYYSRGGKHYILYDEVTEGMSGHTSNVIKVGENSLEITKRGLTNARLVVAKGKTPPDGLPDALRRHRACPDRPEPGGHRDGKKHRYPRGVRLGNQ